jgi:type II secretory pathway component PulF
MVSPRQLAQRAEFYQQLSQLTTAGIGVIQALEMQRRNPPARTFREPLEHILGSLQQGATFADALNAAGRWIPAFDAALLRAGEQSGRLPAAFRQLSDYYENNARLLRELLSALMYPAFLFHMAIFIFPLPEFFRSWNVAAYLARTLGVLIPVYAVVFLIAYAMQGKHGEPWRRQLERLLRRIPLLGKARHNLCLARLASALEALISAGVSIIDAWPLAARASGSPALRSVVASWETKLNLGQPPSEVLRQSPEFPELFSNLYQTGEITGSLDDTLRRLHTLYYEEGSRQLQAVANWTPKLIYLAVALLVAWQVIRFWSGYFNQINEWIK